MLCAKFAFPVGTNSPSTEAHTHQITVKGQEVRTQVLERFHYSNCISH